MAEIDDYLDDIDKTKIAVDNDKKKILESIDLNEWFKNPKAYLTLIGSEFAKQHLPEIKEGYKHGKRFARRLLKK